ncbi:MAG: Fe-S cluster assembly protein SufB, partial [Synechococcaceae cyanobacterium]
MSSTATVGDLVSQPYKYGFVTDIATDKIAKGLSEEVVRLISSMKQEPPFLLDFRLRAYRQWLQMEEPDWAALGYPPIDYQDIIYYAAPRQNQKKASLDEVDPKLLETFDKLGIPLSEQKRLSNVAVDAVFDSVSIATTFREQLAEHGVIFCSISEAVKEYPELVERYLGTVVPTNDNYFAALNSAVFSDGSFVFIPKGVEC